MRLFIFPTDTITLDEMCGKFPAKVIMKEEKSSLVNNACISCWQNSLLQIFNFIFIILDARFVLRQMM